MDSQELLNLLFSATGLVLGWFLREMWAAVKELKTDLAKLREELPHDYVVKDDYRQDVRELKDMIARIFDVLENRRNGQ